MRLLHLMFIGALAAAPVLTAANRPAEAARSCTCSDITFPGGVCTHYVCHILTEAVPTRPLTPGKLCRHSQTLVCDDSNDTCDVVCAVKPRQSADPNSKS